MSTRKIKGWIDGIVTTRADKDIVGVHLFTHKHAPDMVRATVFTGGKGYTEEEVKAMLEEARDRWALTLSYETCKHIINQVAAKHGITISHGTDKDITATRER